MKFKHIVFLLLLVGGISFLAGSYGFYMLYEKSDKMERTTGVVTDLNRERTYRYRKHRYKNTALIQYKAGLYDTRISRKLRNPFISEGSEVTLWYSPERQGEVVIPFDDGYVWGCSWIVGTLCLVVGVVTLKFNKHEN